MKLYELFQSSNEFRSLNEIKKTIKSHPDYQGEDLENCEVLTIFKTSKQKTYLIFTNQRMYCVLDDIRKSQPRYNWSMSKRELVKDGELNIEIIEHEKTSETGVVDISNKHRGWLYTKYIFRGKPISRKIRSSILSAMK